ncbi:Uncharacterized protein APZ42_027712 [Daphnia magna]|uniref:RNA-directed DNA polymerase n=1 Tax=Daphnia magna TaxID=35525 RepID=A0A164R4F3_9CRUS|nr:Uncharacterized protein APZ42_027712 [Daphnia magna]
MVIEDQTPTPATKKIAKSGARIPARSMAAMEIEQTEVTKPLLDGRPWMIEPATNRTTGPTPGTLMPGDRPTVWDMMTNLENRSFYIHKKMVLGNRTEVAGIGREIDATGRANGLRTLNTELEKGTTNILYFTPSINQELPAEERKEFEDTLRDNTDCFAREGERLGSCNVAEHEIQLTPNARPIYQTQRPASYGALTRLHGAKIFSVMDFESGIVLAALRKANVKLKLAKGHFGESAIISLGYKINADGIDPDLVKARAVQNFHTPPTTASRAEKVKFIKSFLGLCSYYRRHIPGFAEVAKPLFDLAKEKSLFIWTLTHQERFDKLKQMLADAATLAYPDMTAEFKIHPDACGYGIGAVLIKKEDELLHNRKRMPGLHLGDQEIPTVHLRMPNKNRHRPPRTMLAPIKNGTCRQVSQMGHDNLRVQPVSEDDETPDNTWAGHVNTVGGMTQDNREELTRGQQAEWAYVFRNAENGKETVNYTIENGLLHRMQITKEGEMDVELRLCIPKDLKTTFLQACHDDVTSVHLGETRTYDRVTQRYYWHGIPRDIENYIKACPDCNRYIIAAVDYVTKWAEAVALPVAGAEQVAEFFVKEILLRHEAPRKLTTDQGKCFVAFMMQRVPAAMETNHQTTTAYPPQANGLDHKDWDATLPFVRFAYSTSRQETTGNSPFFLMHAGHPVLPVETILGATPDSHELVPVEAGGPDKYEIWMLGNLQRAFAEVDDRSQRAQRKYKQHYDTHRREGEKFHPTQQVLVYRPIRKVGLAEKLLHRWHGPYNIVRQITPLNYEVQLSNSKKTEVIHVKRLKSFVDLTQPATNTDGEAQSTDRVGSEGTTNEVSKDGYTPVDPQQQPEGPARPRKQLTEKKVRFTTPPPLEEPQPPTAEAVGGCGPVTRVENDQNRRYPLRKRKKRFALASTLLYSMVL